MYHKIMDEIYSDVDNPTWLTFIDKLFREINKIDKKVKKNDVKLFLAGQDSYTFYKVLPRIFPGRKYLSIRHKHTLVCDSLYLNPVLKSKTTNI